MQDLVIGQNTSVTYAIYITSNNKPLNMEQVKAIQVTFGCLSRTYYPNRADPLITYSPEHQCLLILLEERDTCHWHGQIPVQLRVKFADGTIESSCIQYVNVRRTLSRSEF